MLGRVWYNQSIKDGGDDMKYNFLRCPGGKAKAVTLSYDDGCTDDIRFLDTIDKYGLKCSFNLVGEKVERGEPLSVEFIKERIIGGGHEVANHGYCHRAQNKIRSIEGIREIIDCRIALERAFGMIVRGMAFPDNVINRFLNPDAYKRVRRQRQVRVAGGLAQLDSHGASRQSEYHGVHRQIRRNGRIKALYRESYAKALLHLGSQLRV